MTACKRVLPNIRSFYVQKVPPSGASPVFKLTLPHRVVHSQLSHLIDSNFEIVTSPDASHSWQGTIAPRRNKDRSEYTLQMSPHRLSHFQFQKLWFALLNQYTFDWYGRLSLVCMILNQHIVARINGSHWRPARLVLAIAGGFGWPRELFCRHGNDSCHLCCRAGDFLRKPTGCKPVIRFPLSS